MRQKTAYILLLLLGVLSILPANSQYRRNRFDFMQGTKLSPMGGVNMYFGDLVDLSRTSYSLGLSFEREMTRVVNARGYFMMGQMKGKQLSTQYEDRVYAEFTNFYGELAFGATVRVMDWAFGYFKQRTLNPYAIGQIGITYYNATERFGDGAGPYQDWHPRAGEERVGEIWRTASGVTPVFTVGGGVSLWLNPSFSVRGEFLANQPISDMMDAHSEWTRNTGEIVHTDNVDFYYTATLGISYTLKDNRWRNEPKYNRKTYVKMRSYQMGKQRTKFKSPVRRRR